MDTTTSALAEPSDTRAEIPLTSMQEGMLFHSLRAPRSGVEIEQILVRMPARLDAAKLVRAFEYVTAARDALRLRFEWRGRERPVQTVARETRVPAEALDWSSHSEPAREERLRELLRRDRATDFDLERGPLLRLAIVDVGEAGTIVLWTFHHAILDGRSFPLVLTEVFEVYDALLSGKMPRLCARMSFAEFLRHDREHPPGPAAEAYFRRLLEGFETPTRLDVGFVSRLTPGATERSVTLRLDEDETRAIVDAAHRHGVTPNTLFQSAWALVLSRYSRSPDVVFGTTRACRSGGLEGLREVAGLLINTLPVRVRTPPETTLAELFEAIRGQQVSLRPYERASLAFATALSDVPRGTSLFDTVTVFDDATLDHAMKRGRSRFDGASFEYLGQTNFALTLAGYLDPEMAIRLEFDPTRFDRGTASRMLSHVALVLRRFVAASADTEVRTLTLLEGDERRTILEEWNDTDGPFPSNERIHDAFEANASRDPEAVAVLCGTETLTYGELDRRANRLAHHLVAEGVTPGRLVGVCLPRSTDLVVALLAVEKAGAAYVPLDPDHPVERLELTIADAGVDVVLTMDRFRGRFPNAVAVVSLDGDGLRIAIQSSARMPSAASPDDVAYVIYTSGSTGVPKGVLVRHGAAVNLIDWVNRTFTVGPDDRLLFVTSPCFDLSVYDVFGILSAGGSIRIATSAELREPSALVSHLRSGEITFWDSAPAAFTQLVPFLPEDDRGSALRLVFLSGDFIPVPLPDRIRDAFPGAEVVALGGATEATIWSNYYRIGDVDPRWASIPYGRPIRNARYYVLDDRLEPLPVGVPGELYIGGLCLADGYHARPGLNAEKFLPNPHRPGTRLYRTGDLARYMPCGNLEFLGRLDLQVKVRGYRIELGEIESVLNRIPEVRASLVDAPRLAGDERTLVGYLVGDERAIDLDAVRALCRRSLPEYMVPSHFVVLGELPTTSNGKVDRRALPSPSVRPVRRYEPPIDALEHEIAETFASCLGAPRVGRHDLFFELGGHSLLAVRVVGEVSSRRGVDVSLAAFLAEPTVTRLAELVRVAGPSRASRARVERRPAAQALPSFAQRRFVLLQRLDARDASYNVPFGFRIEGPLDVGCLRRALDGVIARHDALRTSFATSGLGERATIHERVTLPWLDIDLASSSALDRDEALAAAISRGASTPFRLEEAPLLRVTLVRLSPETHVLALVAHHAILDGESIGILQEELVTLYDAFREGRPSPLAPLASHANEHALREREAAESGAWDEALAYFRRELEGPLPVLALPTDRPRPARFVTSGSSVPSSLSCETVEALERVAKAHETTLFTVLFACYLVLLHRYSGQDDFVVGTPVSGRSHPETFALVGPLIDTLALRARVASDLSFDALVDHVKHRLLGALEHRFLPFDRLVEELRPPRDPATTPIFQTVFSYEETGGRTRRGASFELSPYRTDSRFARTDLSVFLTRSPEDGLTGYFEYATALFDETSVRSMADGFAALVAHAASAPDLPVSALRVTSEADRARELALANDPFERFDFEATVVHRFEAEAARHPERLAVVHAGTTLDYGALRAEVLAIEASLRAAGAEPDRAVAIYLERGTKLLATMLASLRLGAYYVPLDPSHPAERNARILRIAAPAVIVTDRQSRDRLQGAGDAAILDLDASPRAVPSSATPIEANEGRLAYVLFTSGSTGDPKGVEITHRALTNLLCSMAIRPGMTSDDHLVSVTTPSFDIVGLELFLPLVTGASLEIVDRLVVADPHALSARLLAKPATVFQATPSTYRMLVEADVPGLAGVKCLCGGEPLPRDLLEALLPRVGSLFNMYGPTETTIWSSFDEMKAESGAISIGRPIHNTRMYVLDERLEPVPRGVTGMLYIGGDGLARGYHRRDDLTRDAFLVDPFTGDPRDRIYRTGDLARRLPDGRLECLGRSDFQVKVRGHRVELGEIEAALATHPKVRQAVVDLEGTSVDPRLVAFVVPEGAPIRAELLEHLRARLPAHMVPAAVTLLAKLPLTGNGKIDRKALRGMPIEAGPTTTRTEPRDDVEVRVAALFEELLSIRSPCIHTSFFELGGHSLLALRLARTLHAIFGVEVPMGSLFATPTVAAIARMVREGGEAAHATVIPLHRGAESPPVYFVCGIHVYQRLASSLGEEQPSYGIFLPAEEKFFEHGGYASVEELARLYVETMRAHDPRGPYVLAGVSFGGVLAFEMARQLRAEGADVPLLVLVDAVLPRAIHVNPRKWLGVKLARLRDQGADLLAGRPVMGEAAAPKLDFELDRMRRAGYGRAAREYEKANAKYEGRTVLIRASESDYVGRDLDEDLGWGERVEGEFRVFQSIGDHLGVLREPLTAEIFRKELARLRPRPTGGRGRLPP